MTDDTDSDEKPNENCLDDMRCPKCRSLGPFWITGTSAFLVYDDGTDQNSDVEWDNYSSISCDDCQHAGRVINFRESFVQFVVHGLPFAKAMALPLDRKSLKEEMTDRAFAAFRPPHRPARCRITLEHVQLRQIEDHLVLEAEAWKAE